jgi:hypothetical protein
MVENQRLIDSVANPDQSLFWSDWIRFRIRISGSTTVMWATIIVTLTFWPIIKRFKGLCDLTISGFHSW